MENESNDTKKYSSHELVVGYLLSTITINMLPEILSIINHVHTTYILGREEHLKRMYTSQH